MDFHGLARRELQALCKKNKIPANITNVAMADALAALPHVEGIEEMMQLQSPEKVGINSSKTGLTSTRGRKTVTKEPEGKKDDLQTPAARKRAPVAASSRRKKVEETSVQRVYSTRRSVRLAEQMAGLSLDEGMEKTETGKIECDLSKDNFVNSDKESDIGCAKKAVAEEALNQKADVQGVADITTVGDDENETVVNAEPNVIPSVETRHECKVEGCNSEAKAETKQDVGCEEPLEVNDLIKEDTEEAAIVTGESDETKGSDSSPVTTVFGDAVISDSNGAQHSDSLPESVASSSPIEFMADNLSGNFAKLESELSAKEESVQASEDFDAMEPELQVEEEKPKEAAADGEVLFQNSRTSCSVKVEFPLEEATNEDSETAVEDLHSMEMESVIDKEKSTGNEAAENLFESADHLKFPDEEQMAPLDQQESGEETGVHYININGMEDFVSDGLVSDDESDDTAEDDSSSAEESDGSVVASDDDSCETAIVDDGSTVEACDKVMAPKADDITSAVHETEADAESSLAIKEKAASPIIKQQIMPSDISVTDATLAAGVESSVVAEDSSPLEKESIVTEQDKMKKMEELKSFAASYSGDEEEEKNKNKDKENFAACDEKKMMKMEVKKKQDMPYANKSLRELTKLLKAFHLDNNGTKKGHHQKNVVGAVKEHQMAAKTTRTALQALPDNQMKEN